VVVEVAVAVAEVEAAEGQAGAK